MKKAAYFFGGVLIYLGMAILFSSYGNRVAHRNINEAIMNQFKTRFLDGIFTHERFKDYLFVFDDAVGLSGMSTIGGGLLLIDEVSRSLSPKEWIIEGGFTADEPEWPASLVHFYDPTVPAGERYLKDWVTKIEGYSNLSFNPKVDHIEWATNDANHPYNWHNGKAALAGALETADKSTRDKAMAFAWRSLGETLHLIADMGCPGHVRDDAHPGLFSNKQLYRNFGNADPYENICEQLTGNMIAWSKGGVDPELKGKFLKAKTVREIAHDLAVYSNLNYFTDETISGNGVIPKIHPEKTYSSPKLEDCAYDAKSYSFTKTISGHEVIMCRDKTFALWLFEKRGYPYIDRICVESQAAALMPQIAEAGANTMRLFIPQLKISIDQLDQTSIKGRVKHTTDLEYSDEILYTGEIELIKSSNRAKVGTVECINGIFEASLNTQELNVDWEKEGILAQIECGGIVVRSEETIPGNDLNYQIINVSISNGTNPFQATDGQLIGSISMTNTSLGASDGSEELEWSGNFFSLSYHKTLGQNQYFLEQDVNYEISGEISQDQKTLKSFNGKVEYTTIEVIVSDKNRTKNIVSELRFKNIPLNPPHSSGLQGEHSGVDLTDYVEKVYFRSSDSTWLRNDVTEVTEIDRTDPLTSIWIDFQLIHGNK